MEKCKVTYVDGTSELIECQGIEVAAGSNALWLWRQTNKEEDNNYAEGHTFLILNGNIWAKAERK